MNFTLLEQNILIAKGLTAEQLNELASAGVHGKQDFATVGDLSLIHI